MRHRVRSSAPVVPLLVLAVTAFLVSACGGDGDDAPRAFTTDSGLTCAVDLGRLYGLADHGVVQQLNREDKVLRERTVDPDSRICLPIPRHDRYTILRLRMVRGKEQRKPMEVHLKGGQRARILGVVRVR